MRAKEYLHIHRNEIQYLDIIKGLIDRFMPIRDNKKDTDALYNELLMADYKMQSFLLKKKFYDQGYALQQELPHLDSNKGEIPIEIVKEIRDILFRIIQEDKSFGYLYFLLGTEYNYRYPMNPVNCIPNATTIHESIAENRDNYPLNHVDGFLNDDFNYNYYQLLLEKSLIQDNDQYALDFFNKAYEMFDKLRCIKDSISSVKQFLNNQTFRDENEKFAILFFIDKSIEEFFNNDKYLSHCLREVRKMLGQSELLSTNSEPSNSSTSKIYLNSQRGKKIDLIRVINALYDLDFFKDEHQGSVTKKDVFITMGKALNMDLSNYDKDLSRALVGSTSLDKHLKVFKEMQNSMTELFNSK